MAKISLDSEAENKRKVVILDAKAARERALAKAYNKRIRKQAEKEAKRNLYQATPSISRDINSLSSNRIINSISSLARRSFRSGGTVKRSEGIRKLVQGIASTPGKTSGGLRGRGRPAGTYKYGIPIQQYKKLQNQRKALYKAYSQQQQNEFAQKGFSPEQVQELQYQKQVGTSNVQASIPNPDNTAQDELAFERYVSQNTITPNTQKILDNLKRIQLKAQTDDLNQQRVHRERKLINEQQSLLKARNLFGPDSNKLDIFDPYNILNAPNAFALSNQKNVFAPTGRPTILDDSATGARLKW